MAGYTREHYRIVYPVSDRPNITIQRKSYPVVDLSERGIRFAVEPSSNQFLGGTRITANITFRDGDSVEVRGIIIRRQDNLVVISLEDGVPLSKIMNEQRYLIAKYPEHMKKHI